MIDNLGGALLAIRAQRAYVESALPHAPVAREPAPRTPRAEPARRATAVLFRRLADLVEPRDHGVQVGVAHR
ncbi:MAG TPA: hypothetical protein VI011_01080 [Asanoa sp.]|jgi:hypothetical protein